jgi:hypothetical protein
MVLNSQNNALIWYYLCDGDFPIHEPDWIDFNQDGRKDLFFFIGFEDVFQTHIFISNINGNSYSPDNFISLYENKNDYSLVVDLDADGIPEILDSGYQEEDHYGKNPCHFSEPAYAPDFRQSLKDEFTKICLKSKVGFFQYGSEDLYSDLFIFDPIIIYRFTKNRLTDVTGKYAKHLKWRIKILRKYYKNTDQNCKEIITNLIRYLKHKIKTRNQETNCVRTALLNGVQSKPSPIRTTKATHANFPLNYEQAKFNLISRNEEIEFDRLGLKRKKDTSYKISARDLSIAEDEHILQVLYADFEDDLILVFFKSNDESGNIIVSRIDFLKPLVKWKTELPSMNPSYGIIEGHYLYQAGIGFIAKINLESGTFAWKQGEIKDPKTGDYFEFFNIVLKKDIVVFLLNEKEDEADKKRTGFCVNKMNGKIISYILPDLP